MKKEKIIKILIGTTVFCLICWLSMVNTFADMQDDYYDLLEEHESLLTNHEELLNVSKQATDTAGACLNFVDTHKTCMMFKGLELCTWSASQEEVIDFYETIGVE